jgi:hypothetical protein
MRDSYWVLAWSSLSCPSSWSQHLLLSLSNVWRKFVCWLWKTDCYCKISRYLHLRKRSVGASANIEEWCTDATAASRSAKLQICRNSRDNSSHHNGHRASYLSTYISYINCIFSSKTLLCASWFVYESRNRHRYSYKTVKNDIFVNAILTKRLRTISY